MVACGFTQIPGVDYSADELYASVCSYSLMRFLLSLATQKNYLLYQTDIQGAYLEADIDDEVYIPTMLDGKGNPPVDENGEPLVCLIKKGIYGLHQSGYAWAQCFKDFMLHDKEYAMGFTQMTGEANMYRKAFMLDGKQEEIFIGQYVDDCLVVASSDAARKWFTDRLSSRFPVNESSSGQVSMNNPGLLLSMELLYDVVC